MPLPLSMDFPADTPGNFEVDDILNSIRNKARWQDIPLEDDELICPIAPRELPPGIHLPGYTLGKVLGAGGFAVTYLAQEDATGARVVIKEHFPHHLCQRDARTLEVHLADENMAPIAEAVRLGFLREHRLLAALQHPCIPHASACIEAHNTVYYAMEYIDGMSMGNFAQEHATNRNVLPQDGVYATLVRLLDTLSYLHSHGVVHCDIKPENILITRDGLPKLIDFGAAYELYSEEPDYMIETPDFSPAEQGSGRRDLGPWTDIYALGATFRYLLTGRPLPTGHQRELVDMAIPLARQPRLRPHYHPRLLASIDRATRPRAKTRYQCVEDWLADLQG